jgi:hypothetical protein
MKPDSSRKTRVAPRATEFFLDGGIPLSANDRWLARPVPGHAWRASVLSTPTGGRGSCGHDRRGRRCRTSFRSAPSPSDRSTGRSTTHETGLPWPGTIRGFDALPRTVASSDRDVASWKARFRLRPTSPNGSPSLGLHRPFAQLRSDCGPPSTIRWRDDGVPPVSWHSLSVSCRGNIPEADSIFIRNAGFNKCLD